MITVPQQEIDPALTPNEAIGAQLRRFRKARGLTQVELGKLINYSDSLISLIENGERPAPLKLLRRADKVLDTCGALELLYWSTKGSTLIGGFLAYIEHETKATALKIFQLNVIPGLLQTRGYASALIGAAAQRGEIPQEKVSERLNVRMARQALLYREPAPSIHVVMEESCLRPVGGPFVMAEQLRRLESVASLPHVKLQIAPSSLGEHLPTTWPFMLLTSTDERWMAYLETIQRGYVERDDEKEIRSLARTYDWLQTQALSCADSLTFIRTRLKEFHAMTPITAVKPNSWMKSSYSNGGGDCVEVAPGLPGVLPVRDSKDPDGPQLAFGMDAWQSFIAGIKSGELGDI
ncbi:MULTISPECIES: helix-turn-helix domain-containing protein [Kitasatospora]|uniref:Scr1 family TA system antitoxin-like transcriptional regulator n=1 Tax=Kitasatospora cathayae TaxID=3004092 RepID=A0ABY7QCB2_9ACTN|nr:Scr1 family TA system antitoxin-like transcriptional regulator [Kitasatospora sp. HUAS 3-15]WBP90403.1 Scr1 family TA system antitoxin-like transcriptional regulator [Kitasatospora sp. HUAS 3-15]